MDKAEGGRVFRSIVRVIPVVLSEYGAIYAEMCALAERMENLDKLIVQVAEDVLLLAQAQKERKDAETKSSVGKGEGGRDALAAAAGSSDNSRYPCADVEESAATPIPLFPAKTG